MSDHIKDHLRSAAGDYAAGDLDDADIAQFEALRQEDAELDKEAQFWEQMQAAPE